MGDVGDVGDVGDELHGRRGFEKVIIAKHFKWFSIFFHQLYKKRALVFLLLGGFFSHSFHN